MISRDDSRLCKKITYFSYLLICLLAACVFPLVILYKLSNEIYSYFLKKYYSWKKKKIRKKFLRAGYTINEPLQVRVERTENLRNLIMNGDDDPNMNE